MQQKKIILGNFFCEQTVWKIVWVDSSKLTGKNITLFMPEIIAENHDSFISRFFSDGIPRKMGSLYNNLMKNFEGFLVPIE